MVINWDDYQFSLKEENEDICFTSESMAWVLDGASGLYKQQITNQKSDAAWFVHQLDSYLKKHLMDDMDINEIIRNALIEIKERFLCFPNAKSVEDYPSCAAAILRVRNDVLEYYVMADCELLLKDKNENITKISDYRVSQFDDKAIQMAIQEAKRTNTSVWECHDVMIPMELENRKMKNEKGGYFALSDNPDVCEEALMGSFDINNLTSLCLCSDGFAQYYQTMKVVEDEESLFHDLETLSLANMHERMYQKQQADATLTSYPRFRLTDDNTIIYGKIKKDL